MAPVNQSYESSDESEASCESTLKNKKKQCKIDKNSDEYRRRRERNNLAVKKSRCKSKLKTQQTLERVDQLKAENEVLQSKVQLLTKELGFLKDLFYTQAGNAREQEISNDDLGTLLSETTAPGTWMKSQQGKVDVAVESDHKYVKIEVEPS